MKRVLLVRIGHGTDNMETALDAVAWHRENGCWLSSIPLEAEAGTFVLGACCGAGRGLLIPGVLGAGHEEPSGDSEYSYRFPVAWSLLTLRADPDHRDVYYVLQARKRDWLTDGEYLGLMRNAVVSDLTVDQSASVAA